MALTSPNPLGFVHRFLPAEAPGLPTLLLLHGTGGDENDLLDLGRALVPGAALLSPRGKVLENGLARFFRRLAEGVFDLEDLRYRTGELADFAAAACQAYGLDAARLTAAGYSNGANIAASLLLLRPGTLQSAVLFHAMVPLVPENLPDLRGKGVFLAAGKADRLIPPARIRASGRASGRGRCGGPPVLAAGRARPGSGGDRGRWRLAAGRCVVELKGLHHLTAVTGEPSVNVAFYTQVLGLRLVKKTVNQDDTSAYHLFYGDRLGQPGTEVTFFDWPHAGRTSRGTGTITATALRVPGAGRAGGLGAAAGGFRRTPRRHPPAGRQGRAGFQRSGRTASGAGGRRTEPGRQALAGQSRG